MDEVVQKGHTSLAYGSSDDQIWMWHRRLGHPSLGYLKCLFPSLHSCNATLNCESCVLVESHKHSYTPSLTHNIKPFVIIHSDVCGPTLECDLHGFSYYILFVEDCTRMS